MSEEKLDNLVRLRTKERGPSRLVQEPNMRDILKTVKTPVLESALETIIANALALRDAYKRGELMHFEETEVDEAVERLKDAANRLPRFIEHERRSEG
ncbi:hypothetical protein GH722_04865 [Alphaproteobacteria bacterium HT1-32]|nr:hypothetical protein [Alphaproteobacteria bacterium HT1-32]